MVTIGSLWLPIVLSSVGVSLTSMLVWMGLKYHQSDYQGLPNEEAAREGLGDSLAAGVYTIPYAPTHADMANPDFVQKCDAGPVAIITVFPRGMPNIGKNLTLGLLSYLAVGVVVAYLAGRTLTAGADYLAVFRITGTVAFLAYGGGTLYESIWYGRPWSISVKLLLDALLYGVVTAGFFGWLWP